MTSPIRIDMLSEQFPRRPLGAGRYLRGMVLTAAALPSLVFAERFDDIRASIRRQMTDQSTPSLAIAVVENGKIVWEEAFGWADRERQIKATVHTMYSLASISKPITATALMTLVRDGKVDLDKPVNDYLGAAKVRARVGDASAATVRRVANHSSGLPLHYQFFYEDEPHRRPPMHETILRYANLVTAPGERYQYSNLGFGILDNVISRVSGQSYPDYMRRAVFLPLGLTHMSVDIGPGLEPYSAARYGPDGLPIPFYDFDHSGGSAVFASAHDLARFAMFHLKTRLPDQKQILSDSLIDEMHKSTMKIDDRAGYGVGFAIADQEGGHRIVSHAGGMGGVATTMRLVPAKGFAVVVLCNTGSALPHRIADEVMQQMLSGWKPTREEPRKAPTFAPSAELVGSWTGKLHTYKGEIPITLRFLESGDLHAQVGDQLKTLVNYVRLDNGYLTGRLMGDVKTDDVNRRPSFLVLTLKLRGRTMNGSAAALSLPAQRAGNALSHWVDITKQ